MARYFGFDYHLESKQGGSRALSSLISTLSPLLDAHRFSWYTLAASPSPPLAPSDLSSPSEGDSAAPPALPDRTARSFSVELSRQLGVVRTNCVDCLDRTNVVQSAIARHVMVTMMVRMGVGVNIEAYLEALARRAERKEKGGSAADVKGDPRDGVEGQIEDMFMRMWARNGDALSRYD